MSDTAISVQVEDRSWRFSFKRLWIIVIGVLIVSLVGCLTVSTIVGWNLTHPDKQAVLDSPQNYGLNYEDISFQSEIDAVPLKGWFIPAAKSNGVTIVVAHGYKNNRLQDNVPVMALVQQFVEKGYNFLLFDFRNCGESGGTQTTVGQFEQRDLLAAVRYVKEHRADKIVLLGYSMGAATSLLAAAQSPDVAAVIADSPFNSLEKYLDDNLSYWSHLPRYPFTSMIMSIIPYFIGAKASEVEPMAAIERIYPRPILFIHGTGDEAIPYANSVQMAAKHPDRFSLWLNEGSGHVKSFSKYPEQYVTKVEAFLANVLARKAD